jgi:hypothetical protein
MARTRLEPFDDQATAEPSRIVGRADVGAGTSARVTWTVTDLGTSTEVELTAEVLQAEARDRLLLALGRPWLRRRFAAVIRRLAHHAALSDEGIACTVGGKSAQQVNGRRYGPSR